ncbi:MAG: citrate synthase/methylcitrate synthase [Alicyclobacillus sp.]|nr:citrate synthase/methylcitrate synthase [Alicyclobacillus sp.]
MVNGLEGIVAAETELSLVDGSRGVLVYRGHYAPDLARTRTFEEVAHLLWTGHLPSAAETKTLADGLRAQRRLPDYVRQIIEALPNDMGMMDVLRTAVSAMGGDTWPPTLEQAVRFAAAVPTIIATRWAVRADRTPVEPDDTLGHVANYLYMLTGQVPTGAHVRALEAYLILTMEHGLNASTFAGRVAASTQSGVASGLTAALATMKGPLHGGAPSGVMDMLERIGQKENAESWIRDELAAGKRLMGFGHRVYKTRDPRAQALREVVQALTGQDPLFDLATHVEDTAVRVLAEVKPGRQLYANVEFWAAAILRTVGMPKGLYTPTFCVSRTVGWTAHILEQAANNRLIRPQSTYVGPMPE